MLAGIDPSKAAGPDAIKPVVLRSLKDQVAPILQIIFQQSLITSQIPSDWKKTIVTPRFQKGDKCDLANYQPITLTCICCKLVEHTIASNLTKHLNNHNILYDLQHGFRERRSCETRLIQLIGELARGFSSGRLTDLILLDFSKAFDKVSHTKLLFKLHQQGLTRNNLSWIKAFLLGRSQCVALEGEKSSEIPVTSGVPQGSVLGPILFLLYINDLPENINTQVRLFADDTAVYLTDTSNDDSQTLQQDLHKLEKWEKTWEMHFNPSKCQVLHITRARNPLKTQYVLHGQVFEAVDHAK